MFSEGAYAGFSIVAGLTWPYDISKFSDYPNDLSFNHNWRSWIATQLSDTAMIVSPRFDNDNWDALQWAQHDVYNEALAIIVGYCDMSYRMAVAMTQSKADAIADCLNAGFQTDHRTLQNAHDHLAAYWRQSNHHVQPDFGLEGTLAGLCKSWLEWLRITIRDWAFSSPALARAVCLVIVQQNVSQGYDAEEALQVLLKQQYPLC
jgi:hypothetical protein